MRLHPAVAAFCGLCLLAGCGEKPPASVATVTVTNFVKVVREVSVTNVVVRTVTNRVDVKCAVPERVLSARKTAPYAVSCEALDAAGLCELLSASGSRVIECGAGSVALVEASDKAVGILRTGGVVSIRELSAEDKVETGAAGCVRVIPLSTIDLKRLADAIRAEGGKIEQVFTTGKPVIRARLDADGVRRIAARGDVRRIEKDGK